MPAIVFCNNARTLACSPARADGAARLEAVHLRHLDVHEDDVVGGMVEPRERLASTPNHARPVSEPFEQAERDLLVDRVILGEKDAQWHRQAHIALHRRNRADRRVMLAAPGREAPTT